MPGFWDPWPGNVKAMVMLSRLQGVVARMYDQPSPPEVSVVSRLREQPGRRPTSAGEPRLTLRDLAAAEHEQRGDHRTEDEQAPESARTARTLGVTGHPPRLRSSLPPRYPNWQRKRTQNPHSEGSNPSRGTIATPVG